MDEKESLPEKQSEGVAETTGDSAIEKQDDKKAPAEDAAEKSKDENKDKDSKEAGSETLVNDHNIGDSGDSNLQNHVEHKLDDESASSVAKKSEDEKEAADPDKEDVEPMEVDNKEAAKQTVEKESDEKEPDVKADEDEPTKEVPKDYQPDDRDTETPDLPDDDVKEKPDDASSQEGDKKDTKEEEVGKPEFETAPNVSMDDAQEDHTQCHLLIFDCFVEDPAIEEGGVAEIVDEPGADEEVCLLPDTEREISEADKAEAEKVLAEKRRLAEEAAASAAVEATVPKEENETDHADEQMNNDGAGEGMDVDPAGDEHGDENGGDKDNETEEAAEAEDSAVSNTIHEISPIENKCVQCKSELSCMYRFGGKDNENYICGETCLKEYQAENPGEYSVMRKEFLIEEIMPKKLTCSECEDTKLCYFYYNYDGEDTYYCSLTCLHSMMADEKDKYSFKRRRVHVDEIAPEFVPSDAECVVCNETKKCSYVMTRYGETKYFCELPCFKQLNEEEGGRYIIKKKRVPRKTAAAAPAAAPQNPPLLKLKVISNATDKYLDEAYKIQAKTPAMVQAAREERERTFIRRCTQCTLILDLDEKMLTWETMDFCNEVCLGRYQNKIGARCANCKNNVQHTSLGKYCVRFGYDIRQFCNSGCLEEFKKGLKICCYCQRDISAGHEGFLAPVGDKGQFKDFCSQACMEKFDQMSKNPIPQPVWAKCAVCSLEKATTIEVEVNENSLQRLCSDPCFAAFKFVNNVFPDQCRWCKKYFERRQNKNFTIYDGSNAQCFCSKSCMNVFISNSRHIVPCNWCKVKKYNFDMIRRTQANAQVIMMCSLNCLNLYQVSVNAVSSRRTKCDMCKRTSLAQYHLTMSDATVRNFCTYQCVMSFQGQYSKPPLMPGEANLDQQKAVPTGAPRRTYPTPNKTNALQQKAPPGQRTTSSGLPVISNVQSLAAPPPLMPAVTRGKSKRQIAQQIQAPPEPEPPAAPKTPPPPPKPPTPPPPPPPKIYNHVIVKTLPPQEVANKGTSAKPMMVSKGVSCLPIPLPIPTPVFIPTTRNSAKGIMKEINKIHDKMPTDPFEAELLMMAEMVAGDKKKDQSDSDTDDDNEEGFSPVAGMDGNNAFGEDMLQMALKMATEYEDQPVDLESAMTANTITPSSHPGMPGLEGEGMHHHHMMVLEQQRAVAALRASEPAEKPDANMCLKYTFGVNAWKQWVMTKNAEIEKSSMRRKPFKSEILQLTADELNYSLCLFVKEVRKPNGSEYAPDTIYYLVLGIQQYLFENGRIDNIFTDPYYEKFTDCLDEVARKFSVLYNDSQYIVTRVEEEHLWESKQLGAHSPHVLLSTLMFFNTKHFNLVTVDEHMQLSFSHIMKHWKRNPNQPGQAKIPGSRNVLLRFYPPQSALEANSRKKKVYEQQENEENPLRCPVKLYEFYISKCPESVRTRNDVFYLQPERSCVPDSPVWYSTQPLSRAALAKMLHRVKMVKEINIALLTS
ncbi:glutamine-rich protein 1 [Phthorimaea operculella]|nr:glutamine-rich protein 1 [Phthorimaea operculella]